MEGHSLHFKPLQAAGKEPKCDCKHESHLAAAARLTGYCLGPSFSL